MNTPPAEDPEEMSLFGTSPKTKRNVPLGNETTVVASWTRLLEQLREEVRAVTKASTHQVPDISFQNLSDPNKSAPFLDRLATHGVAIVRNVIPQAEAAAWTHDLDRYLHDNADSQTTRSDDPELHDIFWSPAQVRARANPNVLATQTLLMSRCWRRRFDEFSIQTSNKAPSPSPSPGGDGRQSFGHDLAMSPNRPVTYADRVSIITKSPASISSTQAVDVDEQSMGATYRDIWAGTWESHDPWDATARVASHTDPADDEDRADSRAFQMFEGSLVLNSDEACPPMAKLCPFSLRSATAYKLLRPLFSPIRPLQFAGELSQQMVVRFLEPSNWVLTAQWEGSRREPATNQIQELTSIRLETHLEPGDYLIWHPDAPAPSLSQPTVTRAQIDAQSKANISSSPTILLSMPACPLTSANALFLARQRRSFVLGLAGPDFVDGLCKDGKHEQQPSDESAHMGRAGVAEVYETGGEEALRAMGLVAWEMPHDDGSDEQERWLVERANRVLFPDRYGVK